MIERLSGRPAGRPYGPLGFKTDLVNSSTNSGTPSVFSQSVESPLLVALSPPVIRSTIVST